MKKILTLLCVMALPYLNASAYDFEVNGIFFTVTSFDNYTVAVDGFNESLSGTIVIPSTITYSNRNFTVTSIKSGKGAEIESVQIPETVISIADYAFSRTSIKHIEIPDNVTDIGKKTFMNCKSLASVSMSSNVTFLLHNVFSGCTNLKEFNWHPVKSSWIWSRAFEKCTSLKSFTIPASVSATGGNSDGSLPYSQIAFYGCTSLDSLILADSKKDIYFGEDDMDDRKTEFAGAKIKYLYLGRNYVKNYYSVPSFSSVQHLVIGDSVSSLSNWPKGNLKTLEIGTNLSRLNDLSNNTTLEYIKIYRATPPSATGFSNYNYINTILYVPKGSKTNYESAYLWKNFWNIQEFSDDNASSITQITNSKVVILAEDGMITIKGIVDGTRIYIYRIDGVQAGFGISRNGSALIHTDLKNNSIAIVKIGDKSVKMVVK